MRQSKSRRLKTPNGAGSVVKRGDGRWMARYTARDPETGVSLRKYLYGKTEQEARALLIEALEARRKGLLSVRPGRGPSLQQYAERWLAASEGRIRPRSIHRYRELLENHVLPRLGKVQITQLEPRQVNGVMLEVRKRGLSVRTCNYVRVTLRAMLAEAEREGLVGRNVAALVRPFTDQREERRLSVLAPEQARILLEMAREDRDGPLWVLAITTGCRQGELAGLRWQDMDLEARELTVRRSLQYQGGLGWLEQKPKTVRSRRTVALPEVAVAALQRHRNRQAQERLAAGKAWSEEFGDLVFRNRWGRPEPSSTVTKRFQRRLKTLGLPRVPFHALRHSAASLLAAQGLSLRSVAEVLGHAQISTTADLYTHVFETAQREAAAAMDRALSGG